MRPKTYVYIAGPYGDKDPYCVIEERINESRKAARELALRGIPYYSPHLNCAHFEAIAPEATVDFWKSMGMVFVDQAWALWLLPGWRDSGGTRAEISRADELGIYAYGAVDIAGDLDALTKRWHAEATR